MTAPEDLIKLAQALETIEQDIKQIQYNQQKILTDYVALEAKIASMANGINDLKSSDQEMTNSLYKGEPGKKSLVEDIKVTAEKINALEFQIKDIRQDIKALQNRWVSFLWALVFTIGVAIFTVLVNLLEREGQKESGFNPYREPPHERSKE